MNNRLSCAWDCKGSVKADVQAITGCMPKSDVKCCSPSWGIEEKVGGNEQAGNDHVAGESCECEGCGPLASACPRFPPPATSLSSKPLQRGKARPPGTPWLLGGT